MKLPLALLGCLTALLHGPRPLLITDAGLTRGHKGPLDVRPGALMPCALKVDRDFQLTPPTREMEVSHLKAGINVSELHSKMAKRAHGYLEEVVADVAPPACEL